MARKSKIIGFSLPPQIYAEMESFIQKKHKTRSELLREMIDLYFETVKKATSSTRDMTTATQVIANGHFPLESDLAKILSSYWQLRTNLPSRVIIIGLGIIVNKEGKVLIGGRKTKDPWVDNLTWSFPGGSLKSLNFEESLRKEIKEVAGIEAKINSLVTARVHPDSGFKDVQIVALYFHCTPQGSGRAKPADEFDRLKWVKPTDIFRYFTTSVTDDVTKFLLTIEKSQVLT